MFVNASISFVDSQPVSERLQREGSLRLLETFPEPQERGEQLIGQQSFSL
jgi:hypothetical protein